MVWIVDDDPDDQMLLEMAFKQVYPPITIKLLNDGEELLPCLEQAEELPRLVLLDLNMPRKDGFATLTDLRAEPDYKDLPVVVLTTSTALEDRQKSVLVGADGYLVKPSSQQAAIRMLEKLAAEWKLH